MRSIRIPTTQPARDVEILTWARQAQQTFREIKSALGDILPARNRPNPTIPKAAAALQPFKLIDASEGETKKIRVVYSTLAGEEPTGFSPGDDPEYKLTVSATGYIWGGITINETTGEIVDDGIWLDSGSAVPANTDDTFYVQIGSFSIDDDTLTIAQARFGPIHATICRNWFASAAPYFGVNWS